MASFPSSGSCSMGSYDVVCGWAGTILFHWAVESAQFTGPSLVFRCPIVTCHFTATPGHSPCSQGCCVLFTATSGRPTILELCYAVALILQPRLLYYILMTPAICITYSLPLHRAFLILTPTLSVTYCWPLNSMLSYWLVNFGLHTTDPCTLCSTYYWPLHSDLLLLTPSLCLTTLVHNTVPGWSAFGICTTKWKACVDSTAWKGGVPGRDSGKRFLHAQLCPLLPNPALQFSVQGYLAVKAVLEYYKNGGCLLLLGCTFQD